MFKSLKLPKLSKKLGNQWHKLSQQPNFLLLFLSFIFLLVRFYRLEMVVNFSMDQGTTLLKVYELWQTKKFTLIGPESSLKALNGLSFFHGPWIYYFLLPIMLLGNWQPIAGSYAFIFLNLLALILFFKTVNKYFNLSIALISSLFFIFDINSVRYSQFLWNPNFLFFTSAVIIILWVKLANKPTLITAYSIGALLGLSLGAHYQTILIVILFFAYLIIKNFPFKKFLLVLLGIITGLTPQILFELKHNFYNSKIIWLILTQGTTSKISWPPPGFYFLSLLPFIFLLLAVFLSKLWIKHRFFVILFFIIYIGSSIIFLTTNISSGYTMPIGWNLIGQERATAIILKENLENYNIVNLLSGDTRDYPLRYLLTIAKKAPLGVEIYPQAQYLFITARQSDQEIISNRVWEIKSFCPCHLIKRWPIQNNISLYLLQKNSPVKIP